MQQKQFGLPIGGRKRQGRFVVLPGILIAFLFGLILPAAARGDDTIVLKDLNEPIVLKFSEVPGADKLTPPVPNDRLQVCINGKAIDWAVLQLDWIEERIFIRLLGERADPNIGAHARQIRAMQRSFGSSRLSVCVKTNTGSCDNLVVSVEGSGKRHVLWIAVLILGLLMPFLFPRLVRTRVRDTDGRRIGAERLSLSGTIFYAWNLAVLASVAFVWATTGEWTMNQTAMSLLGLAGATRGGAKLVPGSNVGAIVAQPVSSGGATPPAPTKTSAVPLTDDPSKPGPAPQPPASPPAGNAATDDSPNVLAAIAQSVLRMFSQSLTDSDGPAVHRIQLAMWTVLLLGWYLRAVFLDWALPQFDLSLLGIGVASGGFHILSKPGEQISRSNLTLPKKERPMKVQKQHKVTANIGACLLCILALACTTAGSMAQDDSPMTIKPVKTPKEVGGATDAKGSPTQPGGNAATTQKSSGNKPADRDWKLANEPFLWLPEKDQNLLSAKPPHIKLSNISAMVADLSALDVAGATPDASDRKNCSDKTIPWIIQTAVWAPGSDAKPARVETYLYDAAKPPKQQKDLQRTRIYGSKKTCYVLLAYVSAAAIEPESNVVAHDRSTLGSDGQDFIELAGEPRTKGQAIGKIEVRKGQVAIGQFFAAKKKTPAPLQDLKDLLSFTVKGQASGTGAKTPVTSTWIFGLTELDNLPVPSDLWVQTGIPGTDYNPTDFTSLSEEVQFDNEGYYWYDFSIAFPLNKVDALEYNENDNNVQTRQVDLKTVYATANLFLMKADIKDPSTLWVPRLLFGIGIRGHPYDRMFVGAGFGFGFIHWAPLEAIQPFAGLSFNRIYVKQGTETSAILAGHTVHKLAVGINIPVKSVVDSLKNNSSKSGK